MSEQKSRVGRPKGYSPCGTVKGQAVRVYLDAEEAARLRDLSASTGESMSEIMRRGLRAVAEDGL